MLIFFYEAQLQLILFQMWENNFLHSMNYYLKNGWNVRYLSSHYCNVNNADHNQPIIRLRQQQDIKNNWTLEFASGRMIRNFLLSVFVVNLGLGSTAIVDTHAAKKSTSKLILLNHAEESLDLFWIQTDESNVKMTYHPLRNGTSDTASFSCLILIHTIFIMTWTCDKLFFAVWQLWRPQISHQIFKFKSLWIGCIICQRKRRWRGHCEFHSVRRIVNQTDHERRQICSENRG